MSDRSSVEPPQAWISRTGQGASTGVYHTDPDCPGFPDDVRPVSEDDLRRSIRECSLCAGGSLADRLKAGDAPDANAGPERTDGGDAP